MPVDDSYTKALLHMNGTDGSTTFTDESGKTWTAGGNAQIDTAQSKFGGASGLSDGSGDRVYTVTHADFETGSGDFTIDLWARWSSLPVGGNVQTLVGKRANSSVYSPFAIAIDGTNLYYLASVSGVSWGVLIGDVRGLSIDTWYHFAFVRTGNNWMGFKNGTQFGSTVTLAGSAMTNAANVSLFATDDNNNCMNGRIDEFRFSKGIARWTSNFTPPTAEYAPVSGGNFFAFF